MGIAPVGMEDAASQDVIPDELTQRIIRRAEALRREWEAPASAAPKTDRREENVYAAVRVETEPALSFDALFAAVEEA